MMKRLAISILLCCLHLSITFAWSETRGEDCIMGELNDEQRSLVKAGRILVSGAVSATDEATVRQTFERVLQEGSVEDKVFALDVLEVCNGAQRVTLGKSVLDDGNTYIGLRAAMCLAGCEGINREACLEAVHKARLKDAKRYYKKVWEYGLSELIFDLEKSYTLFRLSPDSGAAEANFLEASRALIFLASTEEFHNSPLHRKLKAVGSEDPGWYPSDMLRTYELLTKSGSEKAFRLLVVAPFAGYAVTETRWEYAMLWGVYEGYDWKRWQAVVSDTLGPSDSDEMFHKAYDKIRAEYAQSGRKKWPIGVSVYIYR